VSRYVHWRSACSVFCASPTRDVQHQHTSLQVGGACYNVPPPLLLNRSLQWKAIRFQRADPLLHNACPALRMSRWHRTQERITAFLNVPALSVERGSAVRGSFSVS